MPIDLGGVRYRVTAVFADSGAINLDPFLTELTYEEQGGDLAERLQFTVKEDRTSRGMLTQVLALGGKFVLFVDLGDGMGWREHNRYTAFTWQAAYGGLVYGKITAYDDLIHCFQSEYEKLWSEGQNARDMLDHAFRTFNVPIGRIDGPAWSDMPPMKLEGKLVQSLTDIFKTAYYRGAPLFFPQMSAGLLYVIQQGQNWPIYVMDGRLVESATDQWTLEGFVSEVEITANQGDASATFADPAAPASPVIREIITGDTRFGRFRKIIHSTSADNPNSVREQAQTILAEDGVPKRTISVLAPDVPTMRKGDWVLWNVGTICGHLPIEGISHDCEGRRMRITLDSSGTRRIRLRKTKATLGSGQWADEPFSITIPPMPAATKAALGVNG